MLSQNDSEILGVFHRTAQDLRVIDGKAIVGEHNTTSGLHAGDAGELLAFAPLDIAADAAIAPHSLAALMERRYRAYVARIVKPFFFSQFARLDRQVVLVDLLAPLNAGATAARELGQTLGQVLACFRQGSNSALSRILGRRIDRVLFAATKADLEAGVKAFLGHANFTLAAQGGDARRRFGVTVSAAPAPETHLPARKIAATTTAPRPRPSASRCGRSWRPIPPMPG